MGERERARKTLAAPVGQMDSFRARVSIDSDKEAHATERISATGKRRSAHGLSFDPRPLSLINKKLKGHALIAVLLLLSSTTAYNTTTHFAPLILITRLL